MNNRAGGQRMNTSEGQYLPRESELTARQNVVFAKHPETATRFYDNQQKQRVFTDNNDPSQYTTPFKQQRELTQSSRRRGNTEYSYPRQPVEEQRFERRRSSPNAGGGEVEASYIDKNYVDEPHPLRRQRIQSQLNRHTNPEDEEDDKKIEYKMFLQKQIEETNERKQREKQRQKEENLMYELPFLKQSTKAGSSSEARQTTTYKRNVSHIKETPLSESFHKESPIKERSAAAEQTQQGSSGQKLESLRDSSSSGDAAFAADNPRRNKKSLSQINGTQNTFKISQEKQFLQNHHQPTIISNVSGSGVGKGIGTSGNSETPGGQNYLNGSFLLPGMTPFGCCSNPRGISEMMVKLHDNQRRIEAVLYQLKDSSEESHQQNQQQFRQIQRLLRNNLPSVIHTPHATDSQEESNVTNDDEKSADGMQPSPGNRKHSESTRLVPPKEIPVTSKFNEKNKRTRKIIKAAVVVKPKEGDNKESQDTLSKITEEDPQQAQHQITEEANIAEQIDKEPQTQDKNEVQSQILSL